MMQENMKTYQTVALNSYQFSNGSRQPAIMKEMESRFGLGKSASSNLLSFSTTDKNVKATDCGIHKAMMQIFERIGCIIISKLLGPVAKRCTCLRPASATKLYDSSS